MEIELIIDNYYYMIIIHVLVVGKDTVLPDSYLLAVGEATVLPDHYVGEATVFLNIMFLL